jgi:hypothetical protein
MSTLLNIINFILAYSGVSDFFIYRHHLLPPVFIVKTGTIIIFSIFIVKHLTFGSRQRYNLNTPLGVLRAEIPGNIGETLGT